MLPPDFFIHDRIHKQIATENINCPGTVNYDKKEIQLKYVELFITEKY